MAAPDKSRKTAIVTGSANGIGAHTIRTYYAQGFNVVVADLPSSQSAAESLIASLGDSDRALYHPTNVTSWFDMQSLFRKTRARFGKVDVVVANAGMMESQDFFSFDEDEHGELKESPDASRVIDVNLKGTMNTLRLAMHAMSRNPLDDTGTRGSIVLIASTSSYFGRTSVASYVSSKHGVLGLFRASQLPSTRLQIRVNVVAPFFTPTYITGSYAQEWLKRGLPANTVEGVADAIVETSLEAGRGGAGVMIVGSIVREVETRRTALVPEWLGEDISKIMTEGGKFFEDIGGYPLPKPRE
ncbi:NAD(P)-binding protein [Lophiostoma macrostomum CBS 122681]|uniref:NAD(P)-binding protein n=1 Tax=Lophiostoma macrostomum CBS 122681 TaxID=1314788 RepID=A0A6A6SZ69_9PLEO|nr:NAD(P)-binding protein [Lophiostoma macrostomum CBS 122681]